MVSEVLLIVAALLAGLGAGWFASLRWGRPPLPPTQVMIDHEALKQLFSGYVDQVTIVIGGVQDDVQGIREYIDSISAWTPGEEPTNPAQLGRFMAESSHDRADIRHELQALRRVVYWTAGGVAVILTRIIYNILQGLQ